MCFKSHVAVHVQAQVLNVSAGTNADAIESDNNVFRNVGHQLSAADKNTLCFIWIDEKTIPEKIFPNSSKCCFCCFGNNI